MQNERVCIRGSKCTQHEILNNQPTREETDYRFEIILYMHRIFQMFEFSAPGGYLISKEIALLTLFCFCWPKCPQREIQTSEIFCACIILYRIGNPFLLQEPHGTLRNLMESKGAQEVFETTQPGVMKCEYQRCPWLLLAVGIYNSTNITKGAFTIYVDRGQGGVSQMST